MVVAVGGEPDPGAARPVMLFAGPYESVYKVHPGGQRFLMIPRTGPEAAPRQLNLVLNWFEELRQRAPHR